MSTENQVPSVNAAYPKYVERTPLRDLTALNIATPDQRITRSSSKKISSHSAFESNQHLKAHLKSVERTPLQDLSALNIATPDQRITRSSSKKISSHHAFESNPHVKAPPKSVERTPLIALNIATPDQRITRSSSKKISSHSAFESNQHLKAHPRSLERTPLQDRTALIIATPDERITRSSSKKISSHSDFESNQRLKAHRSVERTPLQDLTALNIATPDQRITRSSSKKISSHSAFESNQHLEVHQKSVERTALQDLKARNIATPDQRITRSSIKKISSHSVFESNQHLEVHQKSVERTPLQDLTALNIATPDQRITRSSSKKISSHSAFESKQHLKAHHKSDELTPCLDLEALNIATPDQRITRSSSKKISSHSAFESNQHLKDHHKSVARPPLQDLTALNIATPNQRITRSSSKKISSHDAFESNPHLKTLHKADERTSLEDLTAPDVATSEQRITRSSQKAFSLHASGQHLKESSYSNTSTPVNVCKDSLVTSTDCIKRKTNKLLPCSLFESRFEKCNLESPSSNLASKEHSSQPSPNLQLSENVSSSSEMKALPVPDVKANRSMEGKTSTELELEESQDLGNPESKTDKLQNDAVHSSVLYIKECLANRNENLTTVSRVHVPVMEDQCRALCIVNHTCESYAPENENLVTSNHRSQSLKVSDDLLSMHGKICDSTSVETSLVNLCPSLSTNECPSIAEELELIVDSDQLHDGLADGTYEIEPVLNVRTEQMFKQATVSPCPGESNVIATDEEMLLFESANVFFNETSDLPDLLQSETELYQILTQCVSCFSPESLTDKPPNMDKIPNDQDDDPSKISITLDPENITDKSNFVNFSVTSKNAEQNTVAESTCKGLSSDSCFLQTEEMLADHDMYSNEFTDVYASLMEDHIPDPVSSTASGLKARSVKHCDHDYISVTAVDKTDTPHLCRPLWPLLNASSSAFKENRGGMDLYSSTNARHSCAPPIMQLHQTLHSVPVSSISTCSKPVPTLESSPLECGTSITPITQSSNATWTTPIMLLNKSVNTSQHCSGKDCASETDSLLWNFSRSSLCETSREELINRLENSSIVIQILSSQLQEWKNNGGSLRPLEQKDSSTQTCATSTTAIGQLRVLLADHMTFLSKVKEKMQSIVFEREEEMKANLEKDLCAKETVDQRLKDLETHYSTIIAQMQEDVESGKQLNEAITQAYEQQRSCNAELGNLSQAFQSVCEQIEDGQTQLQLQISDARELISHHYQLLEAMKTRIQTTLQKYEVMKSERDIAYEENEGLCIQVNELKFQNDQLQSETSHVTSELKSLMEHLCEVKSENDQLKQDHSGLMEELFAKNSSLKQLELEFKETTAR
ncbi:Hypothetical predicted protein [Pelobates cultripes]|uniref:Uncharacterized protein n=1 Tax=Pelobates cultripes TaxID=61616 RepID=A0AAD1QY75_PELCU|nr:Hypothetical predicted protein [Pelobates cultripes]